MSGSGACMDTYDGKYTIKQIWLTLPRCIDGASRNKAASSATLMLSTYCNKWSRGVVVLTDVGYSDGFTGKKFAQKKDDGAYRALQGLTQGDVTMPCMPPVSLYDATWLILPVVICLSQRLSHACVSMN